MIVGSHTQASGSQLAALLTDRQAQVHQLDTAAALNDPVAAGERLADLAAPDLERGFAVLSSERDRRPEHSTLQHGDALMTALITATRSLAPAARAVVAKGGITSAEIARTGLERTAAWVAGQITPGVSLWVFPAGEHEVGSPGLLYAVVPGNIGERATLRDAVDYVESAAARVPKAAPADQPSVAEDRSA